MQLITTLIALAIFITAGVTALPAPIQDKILVAWVCPSNLTQQGGSVLTLIDKAEHFDAIVLGEVARGKWMAGSDFFRRTHQDQASWPLETAGSNTLVQLAITYRGDRVTLFRNGKEYAAYTMGQAQTFADDAMVLLGLRYIGGMGEIGFLTGAIEDARIYDTALNAGQIGALVPNEPSDPKPLAWWTFENGKADDVMKRFPASRLEGNARVAGGKLILDGSSYLWAAKDAKQLTTEVEEDTPFDASVQTLFYKARSKRTGNMWDTWLYLHEGNYYLYYLANARGQWDNISMARSPDGVHWQEIGRVLSKGKGVTRMGTGSTWKSPHFEQDGRFFMNFSEWKGPRQTIFFAESKDLVHWTRLGNEYEFVQDERWYEKNGRWDCIWTLPRPGGGLYGYWTATPKGETGGRFGFGETLDGVRWKALAPPKVSGAGEGEVGAIEKIGEKYYMMFGTGGLMMTLVADRPEGPFLAAQKNVRLLAGHTYFARFFPIADGVLVNHHAIARGGQVSFGTLKATRLDAGGTLRLSWWKGNEKMKEEAVAVKAPSPRAGELPAVVMIESEFDTRQGLILEGTLKLPASKEAKPVGLFLSQGNDSATAILVHAGGVTEFGPMRADGTGFKSEQRVDREWKFGAEARFRLLLKGSLVEFYLDDLLMQCYSLPQKAGGKIGLICGGDTRAVTSLKAWRVDAPPATAPTSSSSFPPAPNPFFLPEGRSFGDTFPFFKDGVWHLFAIWPPQFGHFTSRDLLHWEKRPPTPFGGATGCIVEHDGKYHFFYTGNQNINLATSPDLEKWTQHPGNPVVSGDNKLYVTADFRDAFVFFNQAERQWWMLFGTRQPDRPPQRGGCVGVAKSQDLLHWQLALPLWAPDIGPHTDCPQVIQHSNQWYLIYLQRHTRYRVAKSLEGPWQRPPIRDLDTKFSAAGSRPASDGRRWISLPFIVDIEGQTDLGQWGGGGPLAVPRQWDFLDDGSITHRPAEEIVAAMNAPAPEGSRAPLEGAKTLVGQWDLAGGTAARSLNPNGGTLLLGEWPENFYLEADVSLDAEDADFHLLINTAPDLLRGYQLSLRPRLDVADLRPISKWDIDRVLETVPVPLEAKRAIKLRVFRHGSILEVFIADRATLTHRLYSHRGGRVGLEFRDTSGVVSNLLVRRLE